MILLDKGSLNEVLELLSNTKVKERWQTILLALLAMAASKELNPPEKLRTKDTCPRM